GSDYLVAWEDYRNAGASGADIYGTRVSTAGVVANPGGIALTTAAGDQLSPAVAGSSSDFLVVWQDGRNLGANNVDIYGTRVSSAGTVLNPAGLAISTSAGGQYSPAVAFGSNNYLVVWADGSNLGATAVDIY